MNRRRKAGAEISSSCKRKKSKNYFIPEQGVVRKQSTFYSSRRKNNVNKVSHQVHPNVEVERELLANGAENTNMSRETTPVHEDALQVEVEQTSDASNAEESTTELLQMPLYEDDGSALIKGDENDQVFRFLDDDYCDDDDDDDNEEEEMSDEDEGIDQQGQELGMSIEELKRELAMYTSVSRTSTRNTKLLLNILRRADPNSIFTDLPSDGRGLWPEAQKRKKNPFPIFDMGKGEFAYLGVKYSLENNRYLFNPTADEIILEINVDGIPLFRSSSEKFWPILGSVEKNPVFMIALYRGPHDPTCAHDFTKAFLDEIIPYIVSGVQIGGVHYRFKLSRIMADAPARAFLLCMKRPNGFYSCPKCTAKGISYRGRVCFPNLDEGVPRDPTDFHKGTEYKSNGVDTPLNRIPGFNITEDIPLDPMHLFDLGIEKKIIEYWTELNILSSTHLEIINKRLYELRLYCPVDFQRLPRELSKMKKAHEFRQFWLYTALPILHDILPEENLFNFLMLHVFLRLLSDSERIRRHDVIEFTKKLAKTFLVSVMECYGHEHVNYNMHCMQHVPDEVVRCGPLMAYTCYKYESHLFVLKRDVRSGRNPMRQVINRCIERNSISLPYDRVNQQLPSGPLSAIEISRPYRHGECQNIEDNGYKTYKQLVLKGRCLLRSDRMGDSCCYLSRSKEIIKIKCFAVDDRGNRFVVGNKYLKVRPLYDSVESSTVVREYRCGRLDESDITFYPIKEINDVLKMYRIPLFGTTDFSCSILLHQFPY